jgi:hypothetical protein
VYSDFQRVTSECLRFQGYGFGVLTLPNHPNFKVKAGIIYLDRQDIKLLPAGGVIWLPNANMRVELVFPNPEIAMRLPGYSSCEWWAYARGEYGGGSWAIEEGGGVRELDYNDLRFALGLDFKAVRGLRGRVEAGVSFERELYFTVNDKFLLNTTVFVGGSLAY